MMASERRIDHLVLAVRNLEAVAAFYERLGFQVGARNRHPWGTENRLVQFRSSFLELITVGDDPGLIPPHQPGRFSFGAFVRDYLEKREGLAMLVLDSPDAEADAAAFARRGIGRFEPFSFERTGRRPDGTETRVAFSLAFALDPTLPDAAFFVCQQLYPEAFWNPAFQIHPNGAWDVRSVTLGVAAPSAHADFVRGFTGAAGIDRGDGGIVFALRNGGQLRVASLPGAAAFTAYCVAVPELGTFRRRLQRMNVPFEATRDVVTIPAHDAYGVTVEFAANPRQ
jgi:catechol 2,3-dioxygenase-like lactoylglutathione lyase family enzyme